MDNYDNFLNFIHLITDEHGLNISQRNVTVSTCGSFRKSWNWQKNIYRSRLHFILHGSTQEKRKRLMPVANKYHLQKCWMPVIPISVRQDAE